MFDTLWFYKKRKRGNGGRMILLHFLRKGFFRRSEKIHEFFTSATRI